MLAVYILAFLGLLASSEAIKTLMELSPYDMAIVAINLVIQVAALWMLYAGSGGDWFRLRKDPS